MPFHTHTTHGATGYTGNRPPASSCTCDTTPTKDTGGDLMRAMQALVVNRKIDAALERASQPHVQATRDPLIPRGLVGRQSAAERPTGPLVAHGVATPQQRRQEPSHGAPLRPRGLLAGGR